MTKIDKPSDLVIMAGRVLVFCKQDTVLKDLDTAEVATVLRVASDVCSQMAAHNTSMMVLANMLKNGPG